jgi:hypothetical protein
MKEIQIPPLFLIQFLQPESCRFCIAGYKNLPSYHLSNQKVHLHIKLIKWATVAHLKSDLKCLFEHTHGWMARSWIVNAVLQ